MTREGGPSEPLLGPYHGVPESLAGAARDAGVNAVWFHMFQEEEFERCARWGFAPCVELATFRADFGERPDLLPVGVDGSPIRYGRLVQGICLSHPEVIQQIEEEIDRGMRDFRPAGVWLDYLGGAGWFETPEPDLQESCFCSACIREFCASTGIDAETPAAILGRHRPAWTRHKCERIAAFGSRFAGKIRAGAPACVIGVYMCPWLPEEYDGALTRIFAQDMDLLAPSVDVYTPLIYVQKSGRGVGWGRDYLEASAAFVPDGRRVQLILDAIDLPGSLRETARSAVPSWGIQVFDGARLLENDTDRRELAAGLKAIHGACRGAR